MTFTFGGDAPASDAAAIEVIPGPVNVKVGTTTVLGQVVVDERRLLKGEIQHHTGTRIHSPADLAEPAIVEGGTGQALADDRPVEPVSAAGPRVWPQPPPEPARRRRRCRSHRPYIPRAGLPQSRPRP